MRFLILTLLAVSIGTSLMLVGSTTSVTRAPRYAIADTAMPEVSALAWGIFDTDTGQLLLAHNADEQYPIASVTKLMTAFVVLEDMDLAATTSVSWRAVNTEGRAGRLVANDVLFVRELLFPLLLESSNDAAEVLAEYFGRTDFINTMNARASMLGMRHTVYGDPSGLSPQNVSSVSDLATLLNYLAAYKRFPLDISLLQQYVGTEHTWWNNSPAMTLVGYRGGKHGYTDEANRTFAAIFATGFESGYEREITVVLLGSDDIVADIETLRGLVARFVHYE